MILPRNCMCSLMMISDMLSKHVEEVKSVLKKWFKINDIQLVHLLVVWYLVNLQDARCNHKDKIHIYFAFMRFHKLYKPVSSNYNVNAVYNFSCVVSVLSVFLLCLKVVEILALTRVLCCLMDLWEVVNCV